MVEIEKRASHVVKFGYSYYHGGAVDHVFAELADMLGIETYPTYGGVEGEIHITEEEAKELEDYILSPFRGINLEDIYSQIMIRLAEEELYMLENEYVIEDKDIDEVRNWLMEHTVIGDRIDYSESELVEKFKLKRRGNGDN